MNILLMVNIKNIDVCAVILLQMCSTLICTVASMLQAPIIIYLLGRNAADNVHITTHVVYVLSHYIHIHICTFRVAIV